MTAPRALRPVDLVPPRGMTWGQVSTAVEQHYGCEPHEREAMRRASLDDPDGWKVTTLLLYEEIAHGRAGPSAAG